MVSTNHGHTPRHTQTWMPRYLPSDCETATQRLFTHRRPSSPRGHGHLQQPKQSTATKPDVAYTVATGIVFISLSATPSVLAAASIGGCGDGVNMAG